MPISKLNASSEFETRGSTILVVDDDSLNIKHIFNILHPEHIVIGTTSGEEALEICNKSHPDLILLDLMMPGINGLEVCQQLKNNENTKNIPIIFVTAIADQDDENACWSAGAVDFISKPVNPVTLKNRVIAHLTLKFQRDLLMQLVFIDGLTGAYNRRYLDEHLSKLKVAAERDKSDIALLILDVDHFKLYNDHYGHLKGDEVLRLVSEAIQECLLRPVDFVCRYGGEEFAVVLPDTDLFGAVQVAERIRRCVYNKQIEHIKSLHKFISVSVGVATIINDTGQYQHIVEMADANLYQAKSRGRNSTFPAFDLSDGNVLDNLNAI